MVTGNAKRKWRWSSKTLLVPASSPEVRDPRPFISTQDGASDQAFGKDMSLDGCNTDEHPRRSDFAARIRRNGSKLLSIVGLQRSDARIIKDNSNTPSERDTALAIAKDAADSSTSTACPTEILGTLPLSDTTVGIKQGDQVSRLSPLAQTEGIPINITDDGRIAYPMPPLLPPSETLHIWTGPAELRNSRSNSGLVHQLSHKLSSTFGNPTVVHRPNMRTRPALISTNEASVPHPDAPIEMLPSPQDSTAPSSYNTSGSISGDPSTAKTSLESNVTSLRSFKSPDTHEEFNNQTNADLAEEVIREKPLTPIPEKPPAPLVVNPTVVTVETTANAKIFFETHFNGLLAGNISPRSLRRRSLEYRLAALSLPEEQRNQERSIWANLESEHLRQTRVLISKSSAMNNGSGVAIAGYEVVRILGKGSFGVVRLVREKNNDPADVPSKKSGTREDSGSFKSSAIEALKATWEGQRPSQRRTKNGRKEVFAMKVIRKSDMLRNCQEGHLRAERDFLVASESSKWVVPLLASFQDNTNLYLVMEYMVGGDFLGLLFRKDTLKERHAKWYIAEMILCVEEAHKLRWIHRDVKPDNFLISASGHLKISDFGLAFDGHWAHDQRYFKDHRQSLMEKLGIEVKGDLQDQEDAQKEVQGKMADILAGRKGRHHESQVDGPGDEPILAWRNRHGRRRLAGSVVGTSQYMAPEVVRGDPYDGRCDWWSIGIILYECLYGFTPFVCEKREDTKAKILDNAKTLVFPHEREVDRKEKVSFDAMELINSLLQEKEHRLSSKKYRLNDYRRCKRSPGQWMTRRADPFAQDYQGNYVYPDDATDIKAHRFFRRISWDRLHLSRPPFVPDVSGGDDTKYFDEEEPISDVDDAASQTQTPEASCSDAPDTLNKAADVTQVDGPHGQYEKHGDLAATPCNVEESGDGAEAARLKEKKRPRDKVLRDKGMGRKALELRKRGAFLGYTYRRPTFLNWEEDYGRSRVVQRSDIPSFS